MNSDSCISFSLQVKLIRYILKHQNSLQDALKVYLMCLFDDKQHDFTDCLSQVAEFYELPETDVYFYHIQNLFLAGEVSSKCVCVCVCVYVYMYLHYSSPAVGRHCIHSALRLVVQ